MEDLNVHLHLPSDPQRHYQHWFSLKVCVVVGVSDGFTLNTCPSCWQPQCQQKDDTLTEQKKKSHSGKHSSAPSLSEFSRWLLSLQLCGRGASGSWCSETDLWKQAFGPVGKGHLWLLSGCSAHTHITHTANCLLTLTMTNCHWYSTHIQPATLSTFIFHSALWRTLRSKTGWFYYPDKKGMSKSYLYRLYRQW